MKSFARYQVKLKDFIDDYDNFYVYVEEVILYN